MVHPGKIKKIVAAFRGMHVSPANHSSDRQTDRQPDGGTDEGQSDPYVSLCFAGDTKNMLYMYLLILNLPLL